MPSISFIPALLVLRIPSKFPKNLTVEEAVDTLILTGHNSFLQFFILPAFVDSTDESY